MFGDFPKGDKVERETSVISMMVITPCGRNPYTHRYFLAASKLCLMLIHPAKIFQTMLLKVLQVTGKTWGMGNGDWGWGWGGGGTTAQAERWQKHVWRCFIALGFAFIFGLHLNKGIRL